MKAASFASISSRTVRRGRGDAVVDDIESQEQDCFPRAACTAVAGSFFGAGGRMDASRRLAPAAQPPGGHGLVLRGQHQGAGSGSAQRDSHHATVITHPQTAISQNASLHAGGLKVVLTLHIRYSRAGADFDGGSRTGRIAQHVGVRA